MPGEEPGNNRGSILDKLETSYSQAYNTWNQPVTTVANKSDLVHSSNFFLCEKTYQKRSTLLYLKCDPRGIPIYM